MDFWLTEVKSKPRTSFINDGKLVAIIYAPQSPAKCPTKIAQIGKDVKILLHGTGGA